jgi:hypothetical protein
MLSRTIPTVRKKALRSKLRSASAMRWFLCYSYPPTSSCAPSARNASRYGLQLPRGSYSPWEAARVRLCSARRRRWGQLGSTGVKAYKVGHIPCGCSRDEFKALGQVGQESNRRPAVVEFASFRPAVSVHVHHIRVLLDDMLRSVVLCPPVSLWVDVRIVANGEVCSGETSLGLSLSVCPSTPSANAALPTLLRWGHDERSQHDLGACHLP